MHRASMRGRGRCVYLLTIGLLAGSLPGKVNLVYRSCCHRGRCIAAPCAGEDSAIPAGAGGFLTSVGIITRTVEPAGPFAIRAPKPPSSSRSKHLVLLRPRHAAIPSVLAALFAGLDQSVLYKWSAWRSRVRKQDRRLSVPEGSSCMGSDRGSYGEVRPQPGKKASRA